MDGVSGSGVGGGGGSLEVLPACTSPPGCPRRAARPPHRLGLRTPPLPSYGGSGEGVGVGRGGGQPLDKEKQNKKKKVTMSNK